MFNPGFVVERFAYLKILNELYCWVEVQKCILTITFSSMARDVSVLGSLDPKCFVCGYILYISW